MDIKQYIGSGILEDYVLGMVSDQEKREVQCLSKIYPEIASYLAEIEDELADAVLVDEVTPPSDLKARILDNLPEREEEDEVEKETKVVYLSREVEETSEVKQESKRVFPYALVASVALLVTVSGLYVNRTTEVNTLQSDLIESQTQNAFISTENEQLIQANQSLSSDFAMVSNPETRRIELAVVNPELAQAPEGNLVIVFWNPENNDVRLKNIGLPDAPEGSQYQLWTLLDGQPHDRGMLSLEHLDGLENMTGAREADAFAITIEPLGGSESPTLSQLVVVGSVES